MLPPQILQVLIMFFYHKGPCLDLLVGDYHFYVDQHKPNPFLIGIAFHIHVNSESLTTNSNPSTLGVGLLSPSSKVFAFACNVFAPSPSSPYYY